jgi:hypothetical protein
VGANIASNPKEEVITAVLPLIFSEKISSPQNSFKIGVITYRGI